MIAALTGLVGCSSSQFSGVSSPGKTKTAEKHPDVDDPDEPGDGKEGGAIDVDTGTDTGPDAGTGTDSDDGTGTTDVGSDEAFATLPDADIDDTDGEVKAKRCSSPYKVPGRANIWLAGTPSGTSISYNKGAPDKVATEGPLLAVPDVKACFREGAKLYFDVSGEISHGGSAATSADGNVNGITGHEHAAWLGKSNVTAPYNSLLGVFLGDGDPSALPPPATLSFATQVERDYATLSPAKGQIFFIGDGKTTGGKYQKIVVPAGVTHLYLGIMDSFEWNNNSGELVGAILIAP